ncbi:HAD hydrolase family protein [Patescibacteria group bacterium]|nr:HAD hydrolase family protein [Patescibacteria group bacterium]MBU4056292.1 HAD hydrolase family protein [Patescibacteria group bacterium]MBU4368744.1 HAD hydrolase family protein [Patescibacteria group bacterium]
MNKIKIICIDIEGCLRSDGRFAANNLTALLEIQKYQLKAKSDSVLPPIVINSGRSIGFIEAMFTNIGFPPPGYWSVAENGAFICDFRKNDFTMAPLIGNNLLEIQDLARRAIPNLLKRIGGNKELGKEICVSLNPPAKTDIKKYFQKVLKELSGFDKVVEITHSTSAVDITPKGINKGSGLKFAALKSGIGLQKILYIGDTKGDFPAFNIAGYAACPHNATPDCKKLVIRKKGYISPFDNIKGVIDIIEHFIK